ncbi:MAG: protoporphyrinogen oxidase [Balneolales bacterium]
MAKIGIIGGGISGLVIAFLLQQKGHSVRVFERSDQAGGAMKSTREPSGWVAEWGPNTILESSGRIQKLITILELEAKRRYVSPDAKKRYVVRNGSMVAVPESPGKLVRTSLLSRHAKFRLLREPFIRRKRSSTDESVADFVRRRLGEEFLQWPVDALVGGIYAGDPEKLSIRHGFPRLAQLEEQHGSLLLGQIKGGVKRPATSDEIPRNKAQAFSFDDGLQALPEALCNKLGRSIALQSPVSSVHTQGTNDIPASWKYRASADQDKPAGSRWQIKFPSGSNRPETFDAMVYAGPAHGMDSILFPDSMKSSIKKLAGINYPPVVSLTLGFRRSQIEHTLDGFGVLVPGIEHFPILGTLFISSLFEKRAPDPEHVTLTSYLGGTRQPEIALKPEDEQIRLVMESLQKLIGLRGDPVYRHRILWAKAIPQYHIGYHRYLEAMDEMERTHPGFYLAGNYRTGISVGDTINAAFDLAERIDRENRNPNLKS